MLVSTRGEGCSAMDGIEMAYARQVGVACLYQGGGAQRHGWHRDGLCQAGGCCLSLPGGGAQRHAWHRDGLCLGRWVLLVSTRGEGRSAMDGIEMAYARQVGVACLYQGGGAQCHGWHRDGLCQAGGCCLSLPGGRGAVPCMA